MTLRDTNLQQVLDLSQDIILSGGNVDLDQLPWNTRPPAA